MASTWVSIPASIDLLSLSILPGELQISSLGLSAQFTASALQSHNLILTHSHTLSITQFLHHPHSHWNNICSLLPYFLTHITRKNSFVLFFIPFRTIICFLSVFFLFFPLIISKKGPLYEIFDLWFFLHQTTPPRSLKTKTILD
jgi:hypothetical protein